MRSTSRHLALLLVAVLSAHARTTNAQTTTGWVGICYKVVNGECVMPNHEPTEAEKAAQKRRDAEAAAAAAQREATRKIKADKANDDFQAMLAQQRADEARHRAEAKAEYDRQEQERIREKIKSDKIQALSQQQLAAINAYNKAHPEPPQPAENASRAVWTAWNHKVDAQRTAQNHAIDAIRDRYQRQIDAMNGINTKSTCGGPGQRRCGPASVSRQ